MMAVHWLTAAAVTCAFAFALGREWADDGAWRKHLLDWHRDAGLIAWLLVLVRVILRSITGTPHHGFARWRQTTIAMGHGFMYLALLSLPTVGYLMSGARSGAVPFLGLQLPSVVPRDRDAAESMEPFHVWGAWAFLAIIGLHAAIALWHHYIIKDDVLKSMLPFRNDR